MTPFSEETFKNEEDRNDFYIALPVIVLVLLFVLWQWERPSTPDVNTSQINETAEISSINNDIESAEKSITDTLISQKSTATPIPVKSNVAPAHQPKSHEPKKNNSHSVTTNPEEEEEEEEALIQLDALEVEDNLPTPEVLNNEDAATVITNQETPSTVKPKEVNPLENINIQAEEVKKDCAISIGLYKNPVNLNKMYNRLLDGGYDAVIVTLKHSKKVALKIPCDKNASQKILREIRSTYAQDAFIE